MPDAPARAAIGAPWETPAFQRFFGNGDGGIRP